MTRRPSPTIKRRRLAVTLRRLRESAGLSATSAARKVDHDTSWLSRIETGEVRPHPTDVRALLGLYGVGSDQAEAIIAVSRQALPEPYPDATEEQVVYVDTLTSAPYLEHDEQVSAYSAAFDRLRAASLAPTATRDSLSKIATDLAA